MMSWLMRILVALALVLALVIVIVVVIGNFGTREDVAEAIALTVGNRTLTVAGHYSAENLTQESVPDGIKVIVDGHEIVVTADQLSVDGAVEVLEPGENVTVYVAGDGDVQVKVEPES